MERFFVVLAPLEMLAVNLFVVHRCSQRKYSAIFTYLGMGVSVCVLTCIAFLISSYAPDFGGGNGLFIFSGFLFILPIKLLYKEPGVKIVTVGCFSWVYTFMLFAVSVRIAYSISIPGMDLQSTMLLLQTILYITTFKAFYNLLKNRFIPVLEIIGKREATALMRMTMMWFWTVFIFNLSFAYTNISIFQVLSFPTLAVCIISSFHYIYLRVDSTRTIQNLEDIAYKDDLTQLRTRVILDKDAEDLISRKVPFHIVFFDMNQLKAINDHYGHLAGDQYLAFFAHEVKTRIGNRGGFYRIAGDEFVCVFPDMGFESFIKSLSTFPETMTDTQIKFLGFSYGVATYPQDGVNTKTLLEYADSQMYKMKRATREQVRLRAAVL